MTQRGVKSFGVRDLLPDADLFCNSGLPMTCPICGHRNLYNWRCRLVTFDLLWCPDPGGNGKTGCGFFGNVVDLHMSVNGVSSYHQALMRFDEVTDDLRISREIFDRQDLISITLMEARKHAAANIHTAERLLSMRGCRVRLGHASALSRRIGLLSQKMMDQLSWIPQGWGRELASCVCIPFWVVPKFVTRIMFLGERESRDLYTLEKDGSAMREGGICDFSDGKEPLVVTTDLGRALRFLQLQQTSVNEQTAPIALVHPKTSRASLDILRRDRIIFMVSSEAQPILGEMSVQPALRFIPEDTDLDSAVEQPGPVFDALWERSEKLGGFVRGLAEDGRTDTLLSMKRTGLSESQVEDILDGASQDDKKHILDAWGIPAASPIVMLSGKIYRRLHDGGIERISQSRASTNRVVADVDFREDSRLQLDDEIIHCGKLRFNGRNIPFKASCELTSAALLRKVSRVVMGAGFKNRPKLSGIQACRWLDLCIRFDPHEAKEGTREVAMVNGRFVLPRYVLSGDEMAREELIGVDYSRCAPSRTAYRLNALDSLFEDTPFAAACWTAISAFASTFLARLLGSDATPLMFVGDEAGRTLAGELCSAFDLPDGEQINGYPFLSKEPLPFSIMFGDLYDAHIVGAICDAHFALIPKFGRLQPVNFKHAFDYYCRAARHYLQGGTSSQPSGACYCERCLDLLEQFTQQRTRMPTDNLIKAVFNLRCGNLSRRALISAPDSEVYGFLSLVNLLCEYGLEEEILTMFDDAVSIDLKKTKEAVARRSEEMGIEIDLYEVHRKLYGSKMFIGGGGDDVRIEREAWEKSRESWRGSCLRLLK